MTSEWELPQKPFFSCEATAFTVIDGDLLRRSLGQGPLTPVFRFQVAPGNLFEHQPRTVIEHDAGKVRVACDNGATVHLDFGSGTARVHTTEGEFLYRGGLEEGNEGMGFIAAQ
jgi:hypothetical protein